MSALWPFPSPSFPASSSRSFSGSLPALPLTASPPAAGHPVREGTGNLESEAV